MAYINSPDDTICALATPPGFGGVSIVRISGSKALEIGRNFFSFPSLIESHKSYFGDFKSNNQTIDEVLATYFQKGKSYTGDETLEISCHGSPIIVDEIIENLIASGCRLAERGEFTFRAFMNGKIDLLQAESVLTLIESQTQKAQQTSLRHLKGELSDKIKKIQNSLQFSLAHLEANIDFSLENLETMQTEEIILNIQQSLHTTQTLILSYTHGKIISESLRVVFMGEPNVGKSSLFNQLIKKDKAIVTPIAGTTRDVLEATVLFQGYKVNFIDTAGIHNTTDEIEIIGISKSKQELKDADLIFCILDLSLKSELDFDLLKGSGDKVVFIGNKDDIKKVSYSDFLKQNLPKNKYIEVSAVNGDSLKKIWDLIEEKLKGSVVESSVVVLKQRQFELLLSLKENIEKTLATLQSGISSEFAAQDLRSALENSYELLGETFDDQVLAKIFQEFCIGK